MNFDANRVPEQRHQDSPAPPHRDPGIVKHHAGASAESIVLA
jgi:hypothetical protein